MEVKVGAIEPAQEEAEENKPRPSRTARGGGGGPNGGGRKRGGGGGGGSDDGGGSGHGNADEPESEERKAASSALKYRISIWFLVGVAFMTFAGLSAAYMMIASNDEIEWRPFDLPFQLWVSTVIIIISSVTYEFGKGNIFAGRQLQARNWLVITTVLGAIFIASQFIAWLELVARGVYMTGNPYAGFFYILTAAHAAHVIGGMSALGYVVLKAWQPTDNEIELKKRQSAANVSGIFWHFLDILWIVLFLLLGFWK
jgi:cytochrome c oxidase subunit 3